MKNLFQCPHCFAHLRVRENLIFRVRTSNGKRGMLLLNPELGNYSYISAPDLKFDKGERIDFFCPVCCEDLSVKSINPNIISVRMNDGQKEYDVYFSSIAGEHLTFKIHDHNIIERFGEDYSAYVNYFLQKFRTQLKETT
jgi:hypothetical protein